MAVTPKACARERRAKKKRELFISIALDSLVLNYQDHAVHFSHRANVYYGTEPQHLSASLSIV